MPDWTKSMQQTFEYWTVDPNTWEIKEQITDVISSTISRDSSSETLGSASISVTEPIGECYVRVILKTIQNGVIERTTLGTYLVQTPSMSFDGKSSSVTLNAYTPLLELKDTMPPIGYTIMKGTNILSTCCGIAQEHMRTPIISATSEKTLVSNFVANTSDTWISFISDLASNAGYYLSFDESNQLMFSPQQTFESLTPVWTYTDDNSSILYPDVSLERDLYGIPNVVEVVYTSNTGGTLYSRVENNSDDSEVSIPNRGREVIYRSTSPSISGEPTQEILDAYAKALLKSKSSLEYTLTYKHGYCPVRIGDCVRLNYTRAGFNNIRALVTKQDIECKPGCCVSETATYTLKLWEG